MKGIGRVSQNKGELKKPCENNLLTTLKIYILYLEIKKKTA